MSARAPRPHWALLLASIACPGAPGSVDPRARVAVSVTDASSDEPVLQLRSGEVAEALARARLEMGRDAPALAPAAKRALLDRLVEERLLLRAARLAQVAPSTAAVAEELERTSLELGSTASAAMAQVYRRPEELAEAIRARLALAALVERAVTSTPSEAELRSAYAALDAEARARPDRVRAAQIVLETEGEAREVRRALVEGADFATLARARSIGPEAEAGGALGWFDAASMPPVFAACFELEPGELSPVVASTSGYHVFRVGARAEAGPVDFATLRPELAGRLRAEARAEAERALRRDLKDGLTVTLHPEVLRELGVPVTPSTEP